MDAFLSTWSHAHATFGEGVPQEGAQFDNSAQFRQLQSNAASAAPGGDWTGGGSDAYADANSKHVRTLGAMSELDKRLAVEVDRSAAVVAGGRRDLDAVKQWAVDVASTVPRTAAGERMLWPVVSKGASEVADIIQRSNGDLSAIAERLKVIDAEYQALGDDQTKDEAGELVMRLSAEDEKKGGVPKTALDLNDIKQLPPFDPNDKSTYGPPGYKELVPGSGTWVPDPGSPSYRPTPVEAPLDLNDIVQLAPYDPADKSTYGPPGHMELVPGSGTWVPDPGSPTFPKGPPEAPVDLNDIVYRGDSLGQPWEMELIPDSGVWVPDPSHGNPR